MFPVKLLQLTIVLATFLVVLQRNPWFPAMSFSHQCKAEETDLKVELPAKGRIAFHSYSAYDADASGNYPLDGQIFICDLASRTVTTVPEIEKHAVHVMNPIFNKDGSRMTFMGLARGREYGSNWAEYLDLFLYDFRSSELINLSKRAGLGKTIDEDPVFSSDGKKIIFKYNRTDLKAVDLRTFQTEAITNNGKKQEESGPRISPDGKWIAYWNGGGASADIYRMKYPCVNSKPELLAGLSGIQEMFPVYFSNRKLLYTRWSDTTYHDDEIFILDLKTKRSRAAAFNSTRGANDSDPFVIGNLIGFSSDRREQGKGGWDLYLGSPFHKKPLHLKQFSTEKHDLGGTYTPFTLKQSPRSDR